MGKKGFTMIELLVACTILAILSTLAVINVNGSMARARDSKRKEDLRQIISALNVYYNVTNQYPPSSESDWPPYSTSQQYRMLGCSTLASPTLCDWGSEWQQDGVIYMQKIPKNPKGNPYYYRRDSDGRLNFMLAAQLETLNDPDIAASHATCEDVSKGFVLVNQAQYNNVYFVCDVK